jgi:hypothetical protein
MHFEVVEGLQTMGDPWLAIVILKIELGISSNVYHEDSILVDLDKIIAISNS